MILARTTGMPPSEYLETRIWEKLGMRAHSPALRVASEGSLQEMKAYSVGAMRTADEFGFEMPYTEAPALYVHGAWKEKDKQ